MNTGRVAAFARWATVTSLLLVWFGIVCKSIYAGGGGESAYRFVRWLAGLGPE
jgi:hypothetical protein